MKLFLVAILLISVVLQNEAKVFDKCEFANTIRGYSFPEDQISTWVCIVQHESDFNTDALNPSSGDHGIFQISQIYWCNNGDTPGGGCNKKCSDFHNDDIQDDAECAKTVFNDFASRGKNGFDAWTTYPAYCQGDTSEYLSGC